MSGAIKAYDSRLHKSNQGPPSSPQSQGEVRRCRNGGDPSASLRDGPLNPKVTVKFPITPLNFVYSLLFLRLI